MINGGHTIMKTSRILFIAVLLNTVVAASAHIVETPYHNYLKEGKEWRCQLREEHLSEYEGNEPVSLYNQTTQYGITVGGDTLVDGKTYKKLYMMTYSVKRVDLDNGKTTETEVQGDNSMLCEELIREEGKKVFLYYTFSNKEIVLHDFSLTAGQTSDMADCPTTVERIDTILGNGKMYRRFHIFLGPEKSDSYDHVLVEGIGNTMDPRLTYIMQKNDGKTHTLLSVYEDGQCIFTKDDFNKPPYIDKGKCVTPTIAYANGKLLFSCETMGAEYVYEIKCTDAGIGRGSEVSLSQTYEIRVHATLDGYEDSDEAVATIGWRNGRPVMEGFSNVTMDGGDGNADVNGDGKVDVADIATVISVMAGQQPE